MRRVEERLLREPLPVRIVGVRTQQRAHIRFEVVQHEIIVGPVPRRALRQRAVQLREISVFPVVERAVRKRLHRAAHGGVVFQNTVRIVGFPDLRKFLYRCAEDVIVLSARLFHDLDVRAVHRADRDRAVHHEFHVPRAARFQPRRGDLQ